MNTYAVEKLKALSKFIKKILISFGYFNFILACFWVHLYIHILMLNRNLVYQTWIKNWGTRNIYVDYFCWWYDLHVCGAHSAHYLHAQCWRTTPNKVYHYLPGSDFYTSVTRDLCNVLLHFTPFEICSRWTKFSHPNHIAWNVMILSDDNVNWLFLYFFLRGERCNSDVNTVNGKTKYDVIQRHWIPLTTRTLMLKKQRES